MNIKTNAKFTMLILGIAVFLCFSGNVFSQQNASDELKPVAEVIKQSNGINWLPKIRYDRLILNISRPDGTIISKTFESGINPYIDISSIIGNSTNCDGSYTYELRIIPSDVKKLKDDLIALRKRENNSSSLDGLQIAGNISQTGHFRITGGSIISDKSTEDAYSTQDVVHADDAIITGSICVGFDCLTDGTESFGLDTIKLKENSLRIFFDDTSTSAGFPANDWRIVANDSSSGGGNYMAFEDTTNSKVPFKVEANARTSSLYVNSSGKVGFGTSTPTLNLHITYGDSPSLRFEQDGSYGWSPQTWDIVGNESNFFIRDVTGGSKLPIRIQPGAPTNSITIKAPIDDDPYRIGIGTWSPNYPLELVTTGSNASIAIQRTDGATNYINATDSYANFGSVSNHPLRLIVNSAWKLRLNTDNSLSMASGASCTAGGTWTNASSRSLKENIQDLGSVEAMDTFNRLNPVKYNYKVDKSEKHVGFISEDVPELVATQDRKGMSPMDVVAVLTKVIQEQQKAIQLQQQSIKEQQKAIDELKEKIAQIEKK